MRRLLAFVLLLLPGTQCISIPFPDPTFTLTDLGDVAPAAINNAGQVVGTDSNMHAFLWEGGRTHDLGALNETSSATAISSSGIVAGTAVILDRTHSVRHAVIWHNGSIHDLGTLGGSDSWAMGVNDAGEVVGFSDAGLDDDPHPFVYEQGAMQDLSGTNGVAVGIIESGEIAGFTSVGAVVWIGSGPYRVPITIGPAGSTVAAISGSGIVLGTAPPDGGDLTPKFCPGTRPSPAPRRLESMPEDQAPPDRRFVWRGAGLDFSLPHCPEGSYFAGINSSGEIVGSTDHAILWVGLHDIDLRAATLNANKWRFDRAIAINDAGQILIDGLVGGHFHGALLTPRRADLLRLLNIIWELTLGGIGVLIAYSVFGRLRRARPPACPPRLYARRPPNG